MHRGSRQKGQQAHDPGRAVVKCNIKFRHAIERRKNARNRQAGVGRREVEQGLRLEVGHGAVFRGVGDLQHIFVAIRRSQPKVLIALAVKPMHGGCQAEMLGRQSLREPFRNGGCCAETVDRVRGRKSGRLVRHENVFQHHRAQ